MIFENMGKTVKSTNWDSKRTDFLCRALLAIKTEGEMKNFMRDLMTPVEIIEFGNRLEASRMLKDGVHYNAIIEKTGLSSRTIARVKKWLKGTGGGYRLVLSRLNK